jgi:hypothetical protein
MDCGLDRRRTDRRTHSRGGPQGSDTPARGDRAGKHQEEHVALPVVSAIFISGSRRVAVFNDQPVHEGDSVGAYRIETITATGVHYRSAGQLAFAALAAASD